MGWWPWSRPAAGLPRAEFDTALAGVRLGDGLDAAARERLYDLSGRFLRGKHLCGAAGYEPERVLILRIAILACLPLLRLGLEALPSFHQVILYPGAFRVRRHEQDEESLLVTEYDDDLAGESWMQGPIVLSAADVEEDLEHPFDGLNVVIHEIAHKLDMASGDVDGVPPMRSLAQRRAFRAALQGDYDDFCRRVDAGEETSIDPYAAESLDEFFAVLSEVQFSAPDVLAAVYPGSYSALQRYFGWPASTE